MIGFGVWFGIWFGIWFRIWIGFGIWFGIGFRIWVSLWFLGMDSSLLCVSGRVLHRAAQFVRWTELRSHRLRSGPNLQLYIHTVTHFLNTSITLKTAVTRHESGSCHLMDGSPISLHLKTS